MAVTVSLNDAEFAIANFMAKMRCSTNEANGVAEKMIIENGNSLVINKIGMCGEMAVAKFLDAYPDFTYQSRSGGFDINFRGFSIDVKTSPKHKEMMVPEFKIRQPHPDIYIKVFGDSDKNPFEITGWCYSHNLFLEENFLIE